MNRLFEYYTDSTFEKSHAEIGSSSAERAAANRYTGKINIIRYILCAPVKSCIIILGTLDRALTSVSHYTGKLKIRKGAFYRFDIEYSKGCAAHYSLKCFSFIFHLRYISPSVSAPSFNAYG